MLKKLLKANREGINRDLPDMKRRRFISPTLLALYHQIIPAMEQHLSGKIIDIGCGDMPYKKNLPAKVTQYDTLDIEQRGAPVTYKGTMTDMRMVPDALYDGAICFEVLEHVPNPFKGVKEVARVLRKNGVFIFSTPHLSRLHELPHDYFRYTEYGLKSILEESGFLVVSLNSHGSLLSFLGHQISVVLLGLTWQIPVLKWVILCVNKWFIVLPCYLIDKFFSKNSLIPNGTVGVARKI